MKTIAQTVTIETLRRVETIAIKRAIERKRNTFFQRLESSLR